MINIALLRTAEGRLDADNVDERPPGSQLSDLILRYLPLQGRAQHANIKRNQRIRIGRAQHNMVEPFKGEGSVRDI